MRSTIIVSSGAIPLLEMHTSETPGTNVSSKILSKKTVAVFCVSGVVDTPATKHKNFFISSHYALSTVVCPGNFL